MNEYINLKNYFNPFIFFIDENNYIDLQFLGNSLNSPYKQLYSIANNNLFPFHIRRRALSYMIYTQHKDAQNDCINISEKILEDDKYTYDQKFFLAYNTFGTYIISELLYYSYIISKDTKDGAEEFNYWINKKLLTIGIDTKDTSNKILYENKKCPYTKEEQNEKIRNKVFQICNEELHYSKNQEIIINQILNPIEKNIKELNEFINNINIKKIIIQTFYDIIPHEMITLSDSIKQIIEEALQMYTCNRYKK